jgi:hypothetical protein
MGELRLDHSQFGKFRHATDWAFSLAKKATCSHLSVQSPSHPGDAD